MKPELISNFQHVTNLWLQGEKLEATDICSLQFSQPLTQEFPANTDTY